VTRASHYSPQRSALFIACASKTLPRVRDAALFRSSCRPVCPDKGASPDELQVLTTTPMSLIPSARLEFPPEPPTAFSCLSPQSAYALTVRDPTTSPLLLIALASLRIAWSVPRSRRSPAFVHRKAPQSGSQMCRQPHPIVDIARCWNCRRQNAPRLWAPACVHRKALSHSGRRASNHMAALIDAERCPRSPQRNHEGCPLTSRQLKRSPSRYSRLHDFSASLIPEAGIFVTAKATQIWLAVSCRDSR
jgi:hypothetical protein